MSKYEIESLIEAMNNYDDLASKAKAKADAIRDTLKGEMLRLGAEELTAGAYILRYTSVVSNRFDSATLRRSLQGFHKTCQLPPLLGVLLKEIRSTGNKKPVEQSEGRNTK